MAINLERTDSVVLEGNSFTREFFSWITTLVDSLNTTIEQIENYVNLPYAPSFTTAQIATLSVNAPNGSWYYDTDTNQLKAKVNGVVVVIV